MNRFGLLLICCLWLQNLFFVQLNAGAWRPIFKISKGATDGWISHVTPYDWYISSDSTFSDTTSDDTFAASLDPSTVDTTNYKSTIINNWSNYVDSNFDEVRLSIYHNGIEVQYIVFDASGSTSEDWMTENKIKETSFTDLFVGQTFNFFSIEGARTNPSKRTFYINRSWGGCPYDYGWIGISVVNWCTGTNYWNPDELVTNPTIHYSTISTYAHMSNPAEHDVADTLVVSINSNNFGCESQDIVFAIDESGSISDSEFDIEQAFANDLIGGALDVDPDSNIGVLAFDTDAREIWALDAVGDRNDIQDSINNINQGRGATNYEDAIDLGISMIKNQGSNFPNVLVIISDGEPNTPDNNVCHKKDDLDDANITPVIVGIGTGFSTALVECLVDSVDDQIIHESVFTKEAVDNIIDFVINLICEANSCKLALEECDGSCTECSDGYFNPSRFGEYQCAVCEQVFEHCLSCNDYTGCKECDNGYELVYLDNCNLYGCEDETCDENDGICPVDEQMDFDGCPVACTNSPCSCNDECQFCDVCHENGCNQCESGYFKKDYNYPCLQCQEYFGDECLFCQDFDGCGECDIGTQRVYNSDCQLWECQ